MASDDCPTQAGVKSFLNLSTIDSIAPNGRCEVRLTVPTSVRRVIEPVLVTLHKGEAELARRARVSGQQEEQSFAPLRIQQQALTLLCASSLSEATEKKSPRISARAKVRSYSLQFTFRDSRRARRRRRPELSCLPEHRRPELRWSASEQRWKPRSAGQCGSPW